MRQKLLMSVVLIVITAGLGAAGGFVWPYRQALFPESRHERDRGQEIIRTEDGDDMVQRTLLGAAAGGVLAAGGLVVRKGTRRTGD